LFSQVNSKNVDIIVLAVDKNNSFLNKNYNIYLLTTRDIRKMNISTILFLK